MPEFDSWSNIQQEVGMEYSPQNTLAIGGKVYKMIYQAAVDHLVPVGAADPFSVVDGWAKSSNLSVSSECSTKFLELIQNPENSFIFYGDHVCKTEPLFLLLSIPEPLRSRTEVKSIGSDVTCLHFPQIRDVVIPVIIDDTSIHFGMYKNEFLRRREQARRKVNLAAIEFASEHLSKPGNSFIIFPGRSVEGGQWGNGMLAVVKKLYQNNVERMGLTYLVPFYVDGLEKGHIRKLIAREIFKGKDYPEWQFKVGFGIPVSAESLEENGKIRVRRSTEHLKEQYYKEHMFEP